MNIFITANIFWKKCKMGKKRARKIIKFYRSRIKYEEVLYSLLKQKLSHSGSDMDDRIQSGDLCKRKQR